MLCLRIFSPYLRRGKPEVVDLTRGARELGRHEPPRVQDLGDNHREDARRRVREKALAHLFERSSKFLLLDAEHGDADPGFPPDFPLCVALRHPAVVRILIRFGADVSMKCKHVRNKGDPVEDAYITISLEDEAHSQADHYYSRNWKGDDYRESARILKDARLLRPRLRAIFALRTLCDRGRAAPTPETPAGFALLFFAPTSRPRTRAAWRRAPPGLPDPLAHLVCKFWLGEPPRRRRAAPATE